MQLLLDVHPAALPPSGQRVPLGAQDAALLAWLALEGPTPRARLAALLWPHSSSAAAHNALRQRLFKLRRQLGREVVEGRERLALAGDVQHNLARADTLLDGLGDDFGAELGAWLQERRALARQRLAATLAELADMAEAGRAWPDAIEHAQALLALQPLSEAAHRRLIRLHYLAGDRAAALLAFDRCEQVLKDEVGARPDAQTLALLALIEAAQPPSRPAALPAAVLRPPRTVGREQEAASLAQALAGQGLAVLVGDGGIGKSRLLGDLAPPADSLTVCLRPGDAQVPLAAWAKLLRALLAHPGNAHAAPSRSALASVLPELGIAPRAEAAQARARMLVAAGDLVQAGAAAGLRCIALDDLHLADTDSAGLIAALSAQRGVGWLIALRPTGLRDDTGEWLQAAARAGQARLVTLEPLGMTAVGELLDTLALPGPAVPAEVLHQRAGGNPMFVLESLRALLTASPATASWPAPAAVLQTIAARLADLSPLAGQLVRCAAVAGPDFSAPLASHLLGQPPLALAEAWAEVEAAQVLSGEAFTHDLVAEAAAAGVPAALARPLHAAVARFLDTQGGASVRCAEHWCAAGEPARAIPHWLVAAAAARAGRRYTEATALGEKAARALQAAGRREQAFQAWFTAAEDRARADDSAGALAPYLPPLRALAQSDAERACLACVEVVVLYGAGQAEAAEAAERCVRQALPLARSGAVHDVEGELLWDLSVMHFMRRDMVRAETLALSALACFDRVQPGQQRLQDNAATRSKLMGALGNFAKEDGRYADATDRLTRQFELDRALGDTQQTVIAAFNLATLAADCGRLDDAARWIAEADDSDRCTGNSPSIEALRHAHLGGLWALRGQLDRAQAALLHPAVQHLGQGQRNRALFLCQAAWLEAELGRRDLALQRLRPLAAEAGLAALDRLMVQARLAQVGAAENAEALLDELAHHPSPLVQARWLAAAAPGLPAQACLPHLEAASHRQAEAGGWGLSLALDLQRVAALRRLDRADEARALALDVWRQAEQGRQPLVLFPVLAGTLHQALRGHDDALAATVASRGAAWVADAAATLPPDWQAAFVARCTQAGLPVLLQP